MKNFKLFIFLFAGLFLFNSCNAQTTETKEDVVYEFKEPTRDGTGKFYLGREISQVMGFAGKDWLERSSREREEGIIKSLENLPIKPSSVVADIGAGSGFYTFRIAPLVPEGKVYAVEIQDEAIEFLNQRSQELGFENVQTIKGSETSTNLPKGEIDLIIMVDVYHEFSFPKEMLQDMHRSLKEDGKILLLEYRGEDSTIPIKPLHKMTAKQAEKEMNANGFTLEKNGKFLPIQHYLIFRKSN